MNKISPNHLVLGAASVILVKCNWILIQSDPMLCKVTCQYLIIAAFTLPE